MSSDYLEYYKGRAIINGYKEAKMATERILERVQVLYATGRFELVQRCSEFWLREMSFKFGPKAVGVLSSQIIQRTLDAYEYECEEVPMKDDPKDLDQLLNLIRANKSPARAAKKILRRLNQQGQKASSLFDLFGYVGHEGFKKFGIDFICCLSSSTAAFISTVVLTVS